MKLKKLASVAVVALLATSHGAFAANLFQLQMSSGGTTANVGFNTAQQAVDALKTDNIKASLPTYTGVEVATVTLNYRGLPFVLNYATANSTQLDFAVPSIAVNRSFNGSTRDQSQQLLADYLKNGDLLGLIMKKLAETSPVDPIAGNPNSLMSRMVENDFDNGFSSQASMIAARPGDAGSSANLVGLGLRFGQYTQGDFKSSNITLPFSYTIRSDIDPRRQLIINMPLAQTDTEGAKSFFGGLGATYRFPVNDNWTLAPSFNYAITGSKDLGSVAQIVSGSLASTYVLNFDKFDIAIGNMVGFYKTLKFTSGGYSFDPGISNTVFRNGAMLSMPISAFGRNMAIEYSLIDTRFTGTALYTKGYDEFGITIGTNRNAKTARSYLRGGISFLTSAQSKGFAINLGYWF